MQQKHWPNQLGKLVAEKRQQSIAKERQQQTEKKTGIVPKDTPEKEKEEK